jgi:lactate dehydrogenase-like 2-hydroxyacid dehydrogenase
MPTSPEGLTGFTMYGKTAGVIGTGKIGAMLRILKGFGMRLLAFDPTQAPPRWSWAWNMSTSPRCTRV